jgi:hypothetical protein
MTRPRDKPIKVFVTLEEREKIESKARAANLSMSAYLRALALNHKMRSVDINNVMELVKMHGELSAIAGRLKLAQEVGVSVPALDEAIQNCHELQAIIHQAMGKGVR